MFRNKMPRYEILSEDAMAKLDAGWRRLVTEIGVEFDSERALELFRKAGQKVEGQTVFLDPEWVLEQVAKAPGEFDVQARNPAHNIHIGGDAMAFGAVYGPPFVREGDVRRDATMHDYERFAKLAQTFPVLDSAGGVICEPNDTPLDSRHLDMTFALQTLTDKVYMGNVVSGVNARDTIAMGEIVFGGREAIEQTPVSISLINCNSPAALGRPDARLAVRVHPGRTAVRRDPVHPDGRDVPGDHPRRAGAADGRGAVRHRPDPADPARRAGDLRVVPVEHRHAVRVADLRDPGVRHRPAVHRPDRPALRAAVPLRRRADLLAGRGRAGRLRGADDDDADLPGRRQLGDALGRLARGRPGRGLREVHRRRGDPADDAGRVHAAGDRRRLAGLRRAPGGRPRRPLPRRHAHDGALPDLLLPADAVLLGQLREVDAHRRPRRERPRDALYQKKLEEYVAPPLDDAIRLELEEYVVRRRAELGD